MAIFKTKIVDPIGLHARPASIVVGIASKFNSEITIESKGNKGNLKSIMNVMALGIKENDSISIEAIGIDSEEAIKELQKSMKVNNLI